VIGPVSLSIAAARSCFIVGGTERQIDPAQSIDPAHEPHHGVVLWDGAP